MQLELDEDDFDVEPRFVGALKHAEEAMGLSDVSVIYTRDLAREVQVMTMTPSYGAVRGSAGRVAGKTITTTTGEVVVILDRPVLEAAGVEIAERTMAHECGHVLTLRRGDTPEAADVRQPYLDEWEIQVALASAHATDEYRCEAAIFDRGYTAEFATTLPGIEQSMFFLNRDSLTLLEKVSSSTGPDDLANARTQVLLATSAACVFVANLAARHLHHAAFDPSGLGPIARANWDAIVAPVWGDLLDLYDHVPTATEAWSRQEAARTATTIGAYAAVALMKSLGINTLGANAEEVEVMLADAEISARRRRLEDEANRTST